ncbi:hypothetical protein B0T25DRAFT_446992 [Lasiosphaeria hispida]|uniref:Uncharacterized protein n=1 Tax=Lasiosphaeria hispida TaxID=260671 RepID=A0AAJ0MIK6_9PEZI|nr:hypothetical protein B0T25DRAFT_446992 [Lasiosphaeria hispida]
MASPVVVARETYIDRLDRMLQRHEQLETKLKFLDGARSAADSAVSQARETLALHLQGTGVASTVGSSMAAVGGVLAFTPAFLIGDALLVVGTGMTVGVGLAKTFVLEGNATSMFQEAIEAYNMESGDMQGMLQCIETAKEDLLASLAPFLDALQAAGGGPAPPPSVPSVPGGPPAGPVGPVKNPGGGGGPGYFSFNALRGVLGSGSPWLGPGTAATGGQVAQWLAKSGAAGQALGKTLPQLIHGIPLLNVVFDVTNIINTWTGSSETLDKADKLRADIRDNAEAYHQAVQQYRSALEELIGPPALRDSLRRLLRLRAARPGGPPSGGPTTTDAGEPCKMLDEMRQRGPDVSFWAFASLQGEEHDDSALNDYVTGLVAKADVEQLSRTTMTAAVVDSVFQWYPDIYGGDHGGEETDAKFTAIGAFRGTCAFVPFGDLDVYNVDGSSIDKRAGSWVVYWRWWTAKTKDAGCLDKKCYIKSESKKLPEDKFKGHSYWIVGGHMELKTIDPKHWYILPICQGHNAPTGTFDRPLGQSEGVWMTTMTGAYAVMIPVV